MSLDDTTIEEIVTETIDNGTIENVHISPIGEFVGSDADGKPVPENITQESLQVLADELNSNDIEVLCDVDHSASKAGIEKDTKAAGWFTKFIVDPIKGLFANLKLTRHGKNLLENREYRFISPTFSLDENGKPTELHTASLTNLPAFAGYINPILNQEAKEISKDKGIDDMTKEELVDLIKETVKAMDKADEKSEDVAEVKEEVKEKKTEDTVDNGCSEAKDKVENACAEEQEVKNETVEEVKKEEVKEEVKEKKTEEQPKEEKKDDEVIKIEALNSTPTALKSVTSEDWKNLHGDAFWKWIHDHPEAR